MSFVAVDEIVVPQTQPETEWIDGRAVQKMSPTYRHQRLEEELVAAIAAWCRPQHGRVAMEWRMRVTPPGESTRPLVPDVAYVSYDDLPRDAADADVQAPLVAPTVSFEILSPGQSAESLASKTRVLFAAGTRLVVIVDHESKTMRLEWPDGRRHCAHRGEFVSLESMPGFVLDVAAIFAAADV